MKNNNSFQAPLEDYSKSRALYPESSIFKNNDSSMISQLDNMNQKEGYTEFFSWGNDEDGQLGHG